MCDTGYCCKKRSCQHLQTDKQCNLVLTLFLRHPCEVLRCQLLISLLPCTPRLNVCRIQGVTSPLGTLTVANLFWWRSIHSMNEPSVAHPGAAPGPESTVASPVSCSEGSTGPLGQHVDLSLLHRLPPDGLCVPSAGVHQPHKEMSVCVMFALCPFHH